LNNLIVCSIDNRFVSITELFLAILKRNFKDHPNIQILHDDLTIAHIKRLERFDGVRCVNQSLREFANAPLMSCHTGRTATQTLYRRFLIFTDLYQEFDNVIFMDTDLIIAGNLNDVFSSKELFIVRDTLNYYDFRDKI